MPERHIWMSANQALDRHGDDAIAYAIRRAARLLNERDTYGHAVWMRLIVVMEQIWRLQSDAPLN